MRDPGDEVAHNAVFCVVNIQHIKITIIIIIMIIMIIMLIVIIIIIIIIIISNNNNNNINMPLVAFHFSKRNSSSQAVFMYSSKN